MEELKNISVRNVDRRHKEEFVSWFQEKVSHLFMHFLFNYMVCRICHLLGPNIF